MHYAVGWPVSTRCGQSCPAYLTTRRNLSEGLGARGWAAHGAGRLRRIRTTACPKAAVCSWPEMFPLIDARTLNAGSPVIIEQRLYSPVVRCAEVPISNTARCGRDGCAEPRAAPGHAMERATAQPRREVVRKFYRSSTSGAAAQRNGSGRHLRPFPGAVPADWRPRAAEHGCARCTRACPWACGNANSPTAVGAVGVLATPTFAFFATLRGRVEPAWPRRACTGQPAGRAGTAPQAASRALPRDCARAHNRP